MALKAEKFPSNVQATPIPFSLQMKDKDAVISNDRLFCTGNSANLLLALFKCSSVAVGEYVLMLLMLLPNSYYY